MSVRLVPRRFPALVARLAGVAILALSLATRAEDVDVDLASKILLKIMMLDLDLQKKTGGAIEIGVIGSPQAVAAFTKLQGLAIDRESSVFVGNVVAYDALPPSRKPTFIFVGAGADPALVTKYTRENRVLSVTNVTSFVERGVTLGVEMQNDKPKVLLNLTSSESEGLNWDPKILKISKTVR